ncbi:MAG: hypothetical protein PHR35_18855 [Kiritimatiellae bacterium]|nr:hypothetical protein [Kiritimatiellia bacterium]
MRLLFGLGLIAAVCCAGNVQAARAEGKRWAPPAGEHPRLVFRQCDLPALRARINTPRGRRLFGMIRAYADHAVLRPKGEVAQALADMDAAIAEAQKTGVPVKIVQHDARAGALLSAENAAFVYAMTGEEAYGRTAVDALVRLVPYVTEMTLRSDALIYDWCYPLFDEQQKTFVRREIAKLCEKSLKEINTVPFALGPCPPEVPQAIYWGLLISANMGIGELAIEGEPEFNQAWLDRSRECADVALTRFLDEEGYNENGPAYLGFGFSWYNFYMEARRLRGSDWARHPRLGKMPFWYSYLITPGSIGVEPLTVPVGNANFGNTSAQDAFVWLYHAMPDNPWASLAYRHALGASDCNGYVRALVAQFLWDRPLLPPPDFARMPRVKWFPDGGVFMRTGWETQDSVFHLETQQHRYNTGNHNDYGSFFLFSHGETMATEGGGKYVGSDMHNIVFVDGKGVDRGSYDASPATPLNDLVDGDFASAAMADFTEAYSEDLYFEGPDRHLVSKPLNPVRRARRTIATVWDGDSAGRYFLVVDDIQKDDQPHAYSWRMMTPTNRVATLRDDGVMLYRHKCPAETLNPPQLDVSMLSPWGRPALLSSMELFNKESVEVKRVVADATVVNPHFTVCLYPRRMDRPGLAVARATAQGGHAATLAWPECRDRIVVSYGGAVEVGGIRTDAGLAIVRTATQPLAAGCTNGPVIGFLMVQGTFLEADGGELVKTAGGLCSVSADAVAKTAALGAVSNGNARLAGFRSRRVTRTSLTAAR